MLSVQTKSSAGPVSALTSQPAGTNAGVTAGEEERKKKPHVPTVEVSAMQAQSLSARLGELATNQSSTSRSETSQNTAASAGVDSSAPPAPPSGGLPPSPPSTDSGSSTDGQSLEAGVLASLFAADMSDEAEGTDEPEATSSDSYTEELMEAATGNVVSYEEDSTYTLAAPRANNGGAEISRGDFGVRFDDIGTYQFAAA